MTDLYFLRIHYFYRVVKEIGSNGNTKGYEL